MAMNLKLFLVAAGCVVWDRDKGNPIDAGRRCRFGISSFYTRKCGGYLEDTIAKWGYGDFLWDTVVSHDVVPTKGMQLLQRGCGGYKGDEVVTSGLWWVHTWVMYVDAMLCGGYIRN